MSENITRVSLAEAVKGDRTDWVRLRALTEREIEEAATDDRDSLSMDRKLPRPGVRYVTAKDASGDWRWHMIDASGEALAQSGNSYRTKAEALNAIAVFRATLAQALAA